MCIREAEGLVIAAVADGAGGLSGGAAAADLLISAVAELQAPATMLVPRMLEQLLVRADSRILRTRGAGETTAVVVVASDGRVFGASVGDSEAWLIAGADVQVLTARQLRKPLLGSGAAVPTSFGPVPFRGRLVLGSDGLFKYSSRPALLERAAHSAVGIAASDLAELVRLSSGALQDDVAVVVLDAERFST